MFVFVFAWHANVPYSTKLDTVFKGCVEHVGSEKTLMVAVSCAAPILAATKYDVNPGAVTWAQVLVRGKFETAVTQVPEQSDELQAERTMAAPPEDGAEEGVCEGEGTGTM